MGGWQGWFLLENWLWASGLGSGGHQESSRPLAEAASLPSLPPSSRGLSLCASLCLSPLLLQGFVIGFRPSP